MPRKIRLGLVRCDTHAYHFMAMLQKCDTALLHQNDRITWHYFSDIWTDELIKLPHVPGFELVKVWDADPRKARTFAETFLNAPAVCGTLEEATRDIDAVFISDCTLEGKDHLQLAAQFLKKGIPTFLDKPLAFTLKDALEIVRLAKKHGAPLLSASSLSFNPIADRFKDRFPEIGQVGLGIVKNCGCSLSMENQGGRGCVFATEEETWPYVVHGIALALNIFGTGVEWVRCMGGLPWEYLLMHLGGGREVLVINTSFALFSESFDLYAHAYSNKGVIHTPAIGDPQYIPGAVRLLENFKRMIRTGKLPLSHAEMLEIMYVMEAGRVAQRTGKVVFIKDIARRAVR
jgi:predicted dehydrogenase